MPAPQVLTHTSQRVTDYALTRDAALVLVDDGTARLVDMGGRFYSMPKAGALILQQTLLHGSAAAADRIAREFGLDPQQAADDVGSFLAQLVARGAIRKAEAGENRRKSTLVARMLARAARFALNCLPSKKRRIRGALALAKLSFRLCGWTATLDAWSRMFPQTERGVSHDESGTVAAGIDEAVRHAAAGNLLGAECKERGLVCWALARAAGLRAVLTIGVVLYPLGGHCWCEVDSRVISDRPDNVGRYTPVLRYS